jgi:hypothetical protein
MLREKTKRPNKAAKEIPAGEEMARLEAAAEASTVYDVSPFVAAYEAIDWGGRTADDYDHAIHLALGIGAGLVAQELAMEGAKRYPAHAELQKAAYILAPPKVTVSTRPPDPAAKGNMAWLKKHWDEYRGHWVALRGGQLLAVADSLDGLIEQVGEIKNTGIMVTPIW